MNRRTFIKAMTLGAITASTNCGLRAIAESAAGKIDTNPERIAFVHTVLEGTAYEVGRMQGEFLKRDTESAKYLTTLPPGLGKFSKQETQEALEYFERYCPGVTDEIRGVANTLGLSVEDIAFLGGRIAEGGNCSHLAILSSASTDGHIYTARNQDDSPDSLEQRLCTTRVKGKASHIGFSDMIFGRVEGMNEHGLCVTTSLGAPGVWPKEQGVPYFVVVRTVLDRCRTVDEALDVIDGIPIAWCTNFIVTHRSGEAALIEIFGSKRGIKRVGKESEDQFLCATNHYTLPDMIPYDTRRMRQSVDRYRTVESRVVSAIPHVSKGTIRGILSEPMPKGVCCHHYSSWLGTLWSMVFDLTEGSVDVCFGAPSHSDNKWRTFRLDDPVGLYEYVAVLPDEPASPEIWKRLPPGMDETEDG